MTLAFVEANDPILHETMPEYIGDPKQLRGWASEMYRLMHGQDLVLVDGAAVRRDDGIGIAAPQVGLRARLFLMNPQYKRFNECYVCINPVIIKPDPIQVTALEGCLTWPKKRVSITRPASVVVEYTNLRGKRKREQLYGLVARCFQHELDHLNGLTIFGGRS